MRGEERIKYSIGKDGREVCLEFFFEWIIYLVVVDDICGSCSRSNYRIGADFDCSIGKNYTQLHFKVVDGRKTAEPVACMVV